MKNTKIAFWLITHLFFSLSYADTVINFKGIAKKDSAIAYLERHTLTYSDAGNLKFSKTEYLNEKNQILATLTSDFTMSLSAPNYEMNYIVSGNKEGVRRSGEDIILYDKPSGKDEKTLVMKKDSNEKLIMAGQGFNYYLIENLESTKAKKNLPIRLLIPGKLDFYDFRVKYLSENKEGDIDFELSVDNWVLRMVAPSFLVRYNKNTKRIIYYKGLSNIPDEKNKNSVVEINYQY
jgi:hypothetical protein